MANPVTILKDTNRGHISNEEKAKREDARKEMFTHKELITSPPDYLPEMAVKEWNRLVPILKQDLPLSEADYGMLVAYCLAFARVGAAEREIKNKGVFQKAANGARIANPAIKMQSNAMKDMKMAATALGMTMVERSRIALNNAKEKTPQDPFESLMANG